MTLAVRQRRRPSVLAGFRLLLDPGAPLRASRSRHVAADVFSRAWADVVAAANAQSNEFGYADSSERDPSGVYLFPLDAEAYDPPPVFLRPFDFTDWSATLDELQNALTAGSFAIVDFSRLTAQETKRAVDSMDKVVMAMQSHIHRGDGDRFRILPSSKTWAAGPKSPGIGDPTRHRGSHDPGGSRTTP